jgi:hypothetical protein
MFSLTGQPNHAWDDKLPGYTAFEVIQDAVAARLARRRDELVDVVRAAGDPQAAGLSTPGAILVRPDRHVGFRAAPADAEGLAALDAHLDSYLVPA